MRKYRVFICHAWDHRHHYDELVAMLNAVPGFSWKNESVPQHDPLFGSNGALKKQIRDRIRDCEAFLVPGAMYVANSEWIEFELEFARIAAQSIIVVKPSGQARIPVIARKPADKIVGWGGQAVTDAIRQFAKPLQ